MHSPILRALIALAACAPLAAAQRVDDGALLPKRAVIAGAFYTYDSWNEYWEGTLKRRNGNVGTVTTQSVAWMAGYGATDRLTVMAALPYVWTSASQGVLQGQSGVQDLTMAAKYRLYATRLAQEGSVSVFIAGVAGLPVGDYTPDVMPLSLGTAGRRAAARLTLHAQPTRAWFADATAAYTFCSNVKLERSSYYTDGQLYLTNEVAMPNVVDYALRAGTQRGRWLVPVAVVRQQTLGGGDIRRQDMPFVSNRMNFTRLEGAVLYALPANVSAQLAVGHVLAGRNVGQSTAFTTGLMYAFHY